MFLGNGETFQRSWAIATPLTYTVDCCGFLLWGIPEVVVYPRRLCAGGLRDALDGSGARGTRMHQQRAQALDCAPSSGLPCLDDPPLQGPSPTVTRGPVDLVPAQCRQAR